MLIKIEVVHARLADEAVGIGGGVLGRDVGEELHRVDVAGDVAAERRVGQLVDRLDERDEAGAVQVRLVGLGLERDRDVLHWLVTLRGEIPGLRVLVLEEVPAVFPVPLREELLLHVLDEVVEAPILAVDRQPREGDPGGGDAERLVDRQRQHLADEARVLDGVLDVDRAVAVERLALHVLVEIDLDRGLLAAARALPPRADADLLDDLAVDRDVGRVVLVRAEVVAQRLPVRGVDDDMDLVEHRDVEHRVRGAPDAAASTRRAASEAVMAARAAGGRGW